MPPHISILIIDRNESVKAEIGTMLSNLGSAVQLLDSVTELEDGVKVITRTNPMVVLLGVDDLDNAIEKVRELHSRFPRTSIFTVSGRKDSDWILALMRAGAVEYLLKPLDQGELNESLQKIGRIWIQKTTDYVKPGKIVTVYNPIGGMGTTTIAVNLAASFTTGDEKVALVDLNLICGDVASFLDVNPSYTLSSVTSNIARLDANFLMTAMTRHSSGIYVLTEPLEVHESFDITPDQIKRMLTFLRGIFTYVVIDAGGLMTGCNMAVFESSDVIVYNTVLNLPALKNAKRYLTAFERLGFHKNRIKVIVNRYIQKADIKISDAEKVLKASIFQTIPNDYNEVIESINRGIPLVKLSSSSPVSRALIKLAEMIK